MLRERWRTETRYTIYCFHNYSHTVHPSQKADQGRRKMSTCNRSSKKDATHSNTTAGHYMCTGRKQEARVCLSGQECHMTGLELGKGRGGVKRRGESDVGAEFLAAKNHTSGCPILFPLSLVPSRAELFTHCCNPC